MKTNYTNRFLSALLRHACIAGLGGCLLPAGVLAQPTVTSIAPLPNARAAVATSVVSFGFSQPLTANSAGALKVYSAQRGGLRTRGATPAAVNGNTLSFTPTAYPFMPGETVFSSVTPNAASNSGSLAYGKVVQFTAAVGGAGRGVFVASTDARLANQETALGDVDGDGDLDLVSTSYMSSSSIGMSLNGGDATGSNTGIFFNTSYVAISSGLSDLVLGDVDGDGDLDIVTADPNNNRVSVWWNSGTSASTADARFNRTTYTALSASPGDIKLGDVDGDGDLDLVVSTTNTLEVRLNGGDATGSSTGIFSNGSTNSPNSQYSRLDLGDVDGDGDLDLVVTSFIAGTASVKLNGGDATGSNTGVFSGGTSTVVIASPNAIKLGDVDGDGDLDLVTASHSTGMASVKLNGGDATGSNTGVFSNGSTVTVSGYNASALALGDVDSDGDLDLAVVDITNRLASVRLNGGNGTGSNTGVFSNGSNVTVGYSVTSVMLGDVDGDGDLDLLTGNSNDNTVSVRLNASATPTILGITAVSPIGNTIAAARNSSVTATFTHPLTVGSVAGLKVYSAQRGGLRTRSITPAAVNGSTLSFSPTYPFLPGETVSSTITRAATSSNATLARRKVFQFTAAVGGTGRGYFGGGTDPTVGSGPCSVALADVDGDGDLDLLAANSNDNNVSVRLNGGNSTGSNTGTFSNGSTVVVGAVPCCVVAGDVDGDGDLDMIVANSSSNTVTIKLNGGDGTGSGTGLFSNGTTLAVAANPRSIALGDLDGDGDLDMVVANYVPSGGSTVNVCVNGGDSTGSNTGLFSVTSTGASITGGFTGVALGDIDGDGDLDIVAAAYGYAFNRRPQVAVFSNISDTAAPNVPFFVGFANGSAVTVGTDTYTGAYAVALGDVDGDGDLDLLVTIRGVAGAPSGATYTVNVRLNGGNATGSNTGTFSNGSDVRVGEFPTYVALGDVDGDGDLDLLSANESPTTTYGGTGALVPYPSVSVRLNGGNSTGSNTGTFSNGANINLGAPFVSAVLGDVDGDGDLDFVAATSKYTYPAVVPTTTVSVRLNGSSPLAAVTEKAFVVASLVIAPTVGTGESPRYSYTGPPLKNGATLGLYSLTGQRVWEQSVSGIPTGTIPVNGLASGWYVLRLKTADSSFMGRFFQP